MADLGPQTARTSPEASSEDRGARGGFPPRSFSPSSSQFLVKAPEAHLCTHRPGSQDVSTEIQALRLHLGVAGAAVVGEVWEVGAALEDLHVMDQGFIATCDHRLILREEGERWSHSKPCQHS